MITILKTQREVLPAAKLIGKRYTDADRDDSGGFGVQWGQWFANHWFEPLLGADLAGNCSDPVGAMRCTAAGFEYWIGVLAAPEHPVPEGYEAVRIPEGDLGVCFLYGKENSADLFGMEAHNACVQAWADLGWHPQPDVWYLERYNCPRYTVPDENGNVILDYCTCLPPIFKE